jgi:hypothetical protein
MGLFHTKVASTPDDGTSEVGSNEWNNDHVVDTNGLLLVSDTNTPSAPAAGFIKVYGEDLVGRQLPAFIGPSGLDTPLQPFLGRNAICSYKGQIASTIVTGHGMQITPVGTTTATSWANTNLHQQMNRTSFRVTTAATTAIAGFRTPNVMMWRGNAAGRGGFFYVCRWGPDTGTSTTTLRGFCGIVGSPSAPTDVAISSRVNIFGMGWDSGDANIQFYASGAVAQAKANTGIPSPVGLGDATQIYEIVIFCKPNDTEMSVLITNIETGASYSETVTTAARLIPNTTGISPQGWVSVGGTSSVAGVALMNAYLEIDL